MTDFNVADAVKAMRDAAAIFGTFNQTNKQETLLDIAGKVERFRSFASDKQRDFARSLVSQARSAARERATGVSADPAVTEARTAYTGPRVNGAKPIGSAPKIAALFGVDKAAHIHVGPVHIAARYEFDKFWLCYEDTCYGFMLPNGDMFASKNGRALPDQLTKLLAALVMIEADPLRAMQQHGTDTGRCSICNRHLTNEESIGLGIGPICRGRIGL
jgi:hypothetical protein